ncbi:hypothetical protein QYE76_064209 [Lolium multiflorum]|uniref:CCHC-type domain-containing protein n=1 Tax=Lolium multiflorum TaxID=4521 RepID=A0AAD8S709_LOLMU|nr:hypothetical protein QYE76_064209 [Lolium multiflorum]
MCSQPRPAASTSTLVLPEEVPAPPPCPPRPYHRNRTVTVAVTPTGPRSSDGLLYDPAVLVEGLGSLSLPPVASDGHAEVASDDDDDIGELAPQSLLTSTTGTVSSEVCGTADLCHVEGAPTEPCGGLSAVPTALGYGEGWVKVGRGGRPSREPSSLLREEGLERSIAFKRWARGRCFRCLERGHQVNNCREPFRCIRCRRPGHRERFCRAHFPAARSRSPDTRARSPNAHAPCRRSASPSAQPRRPSVSQSWVEVVCLSPATLPPRPSPKCCEEVNVNANLDSRLQCQFALFRMEVDQLVANRVEEAARPLRDEVASLKLLLARVGASLEPTEACSSGGQELGTVQASFPLGSADQKSSVVEEEHIYSCFSPHDSPYQSLQPVVLAASEGEGIDGTLTPVSTASSPLSQALGFELCEDPSPPLSMVHLHVDSLVTSKVASAPPPVEASRCGDKVIEVGALAPNSDALFASELCDLLARLEATSPGSSKEIARLLEEKSSRKIQKVKDYLRSRSKKSGATRKEIAVGCWMILHSYMKVCRCRSYL